MRWTLMALLRLRDDLAPTVGVLVLVLVTAFAAALAPRILAALGDEAVQAQVAAATASERAIVLIEHQVTRPGPQDDPLAEVRAAGDDLRATFPRRIERIVDDGYIVVDSARYRVDTRTTDPAFLRMRVQEGIDAHITYVEGRPPTSEVVRRDGVGPEKEDDVPVYQVAISRATADRFDLELGQAVPLSGDPGDPLFGRSQLAVHAFAEITGIYEVPDPGSEYWRDDPLPIRPVIRALSSELQLLDAVAILDAAAYGELADINDANHRPLRLQWRYGVDAGQVTARSAPDLLRAFRALAVQYPSANVGAGRETAMRTGMLALLEAHQAAWTAAGSVIAVVVVGPALVALATMVLIASLAGRRRRSTMALVRSRGGAVAQVLVPSALEGVLLAVPAAALAAVAAAVVVPAGQTQATILAAGAVAVAAVLVIVGTVVPVARALGPERRAGERSGRRSGPRRLVGEALVVGLAVGGAFLLRERGLGSAALSAPGTGVDPLLAAVPALVGVAAGLIVLRVVPAVMRAAASLARRRRGLVPLLAARRGTEGGIGTAILLVLLATSTVGTFALVALDSLDRGAELAAWHKTGGAYRLGVPDGALPNGLDPERLPGVEAAASEFRALIPIAPSGLQTMYAAVGAAALEQVLDGTPIAPSWPAGATTPGAGPIPAVVSQDLVANPRGVQAGETFEMSVQGYTLTYLAAAVADSWPGLPEGRPFVVVPREWVAAQAPAARLVPTGVVLRAPATAEAASAIRAAVAAVSPVVAVTSQAEDAEARRSAPVTEAIRGVIIAAAAVTALYAALGVAAALALAALARVVEVAHLRTLGLTSRQVFLLTAAEHGPTTLLAFVAGVMLGLGLFAVVRPALGLDALVGVRVEVPVVLDPRAALAVLGVLAGVVLLGISVGSLLVRRVAPTSVLRGRFRVMPILPAAPDSAQLPSAGTAGSATGRRDPLAGASLAQPPRVRYGEGAVIVCDGLVRIFKLAELEVVALQGLDLLVEGGEMIAIVGASGSGKSTLLSILGGMDVPSAGRAVVAGYDLGRMGGSERTRFRRRTVGFVWQQTGRNLLPYLSAAENVELPMLLDGRKARTARARELLDLVGLGDRASHRPDRLSGGEQQRVAIAIALANDPAVILADEPTGELDSATSADVFGLLRRVNAEMGTTIVIVTHDAFVSEQVGRTVAIRDGRTSTETLRRTEQTEEGHDRVISEEYAVLDRAGRLQLPRSHVESLELRSRVRLRLEEDHVGVWPDLERPGPAGEEPTPGDARPAGEEDGR